MKLFYKIAIITSVVSLSTLSIANVGKATNQQPILKNKEVMQPISENEGITKSIKNFLEYLFYDKDKELDRLEEELKKESKALDKEIYKLNKELLELEIERAKQINRCLQIEECRNGMNRSTFQ